MCRFEDDIKMIAPNIHIPSYAKRFENVVEVVRCKDCKYLNIINTAHVYTFCGKHNRIFYLWEEDTREQFCSWGERKEDADFEEPEINPCRECEDYDGKGGCLSKGGCGERREDAEKTN